MGKVIRISDKAYDFLAEQRWTRRLISYESILDDILDEFFPEYEDYEED